MSEDNLFDGATAWFSTSVNDENKKLWGEHGGRYSVSINNACYIFSDDVKANDTQQIFKSSANEDLVLFKSEWINEALDVSKNGKLCTFGIEKFILLSQSVEEELKLYADEERYKKFVEADKAQRAENRKDFEEYLRTIDKQDKRMKRSPRKSTIRTVGASVKSNSPCSSSVSPKHVVSSKRSVRQSDIQDTPSKKVYSLRNPSRSSPNVQDSPSRNTYSLRRLSQGVERSRTCPSRKSKRLSNRQHNLIDHTSTRKKTNSQISEQSSDEESSQNSQSTEDDISVTHSSSHDKRKRSVNTETKLKRLKDIANVTQPSLLRKSKRLSNRNKVIPDHLRKKRGSHGSHDTGEVVANLVINLAPHTNKESEVWSQNSCSSHDEEHLDQLNTKSRKNTHPEEVSGKLLQVSNSKETSREEEMKSSLSPTQLGKEDTNRTKKKSASSSFSHVNKSRSTSQSDFTNQQPISDEYANQQPISEDHASDAETVVKQKGLNEPPQTVYPSRIRKSVNYNEESQTDCTKLSDAVVDEHAITPTDGRRKRKLYRTSSSGLLLGEEEKCNGVEDQNMDTHDKTPTDQLSPKEINDMLGVRKQRPDDLKSQTSSCTPTLLTSRLTDRRDMKESRSATMKAHKMVVHHRKLGEKYVQDFAFGSFSGFTHIDDLDVPNVVIEDFIVNKKGCRVKLVKNALSRSDFSTQICPPAYDLATLASMTFTLSERLGMDVRANF